MEALWLQRGDPANAECSCDKNSHHTLKARLAKPEFHEARKAARAALWALREHQPIIERLFQLEVEVPAALLGGVESALWEPENVF